MIERLKSIECRLQRMALAVIVGLIALSTSSCNQNPKACIQLEEVYELDRTYYLESCSENYEFITWDFGYKTGGYIGDVAPHTFSRLGDFTISVDAYSNGAYFSDRATQEIKVAHRYIEKIEIVGTSNYTDFLFVYGADSIYFEDAKGVFTEASPFVGQILQNDTLEIPYDSEDHTLVGYKTFNPTMLIRKSSINFRKNTDNPVLLSGAGFDMYIYWVYI